jgi:hypothetical protein
MVTPDREPVRVTVELLISADVEDTAAYVRERVLRDTEAAYPAVLIEDVWREDPE